MLLAIAMQESDLKNRTQVDAYGEPLPKLARSFWQIEHPTVDLILNHERCMWLEPRVAELRYFPSTRIVHEKIAENDILACALAAALLWSDTKRLPGIGDEAEAWNCYIRNWRPSKPRPEDWPKNYSLAIGTVINESASYVS
jgi:hypothetical protein